MINIVHISDTWNQLQKYLDNRWEPKEPERHSKSQDINKRTDTALFYTICYTAWTCSIYLWPKRFLHWAGWSCPGVPIPPKESTNARGANKILKELIRTMRGWKEGLHIWTPDSGYHQTDSSIAKQWVGGPKPEAPIPPNSTSAWGANINILRI